MKYKVLLIGRNKVMIEDLFLHAREEEYELQTSSMRYRDIVSHIRYFKPDAIFYCMNKEEKERTDVVVSLRKSLEENRVALVLIGDNKECEDFKSNNGDLGDLILKKPISARTILESAAALLKERKDFESQDPIQSAKDIAVELMGKISQDDTLRKIANKVEQEGSNRQEFPFSQKQGDLQANSPAGKGDAAEKKHILVVDDDPMMLKLIKEQLKENYVVATAVNGIIALRFLENKKTDLILLDYEMPGENGASVLEKIRNNPATAKLPVIFLTGIKEREKIQQVMRLKPQGYLLKPIEREALLECIRKTIG